MQSVDGGRCRMTKTRMPQLRGDNSNMAARRHVWNGVEILVAIAPKKDHFVLEILNRKT